ncbi:MAG: SLC13 family permease [Dehalococcoidaceae bacterium]|nr:SLC13 family permease [Dehalococcoidaceae bacterium]
MDTGIITVLVILGAVVVLLVTDILRIDIIALICLLALAWTGILEAGEALSGFSSNAVIAMLSVMVMGRGIAKTGVMDRFAHVVAQISGINRPRIVGVISASVGLLSGIVQNVGAAVLFLPSILNVSRRLNISASSLIMPIGFAAILGGNLTMVGSGPLILVNDFLLDASLEPFSFFAVTPAGIILLACGIAFFYFFGNLFLPDRTRDKSENSSQQKIIQTWDLPETINHYLIPADSLLDGKTIEEAGIWKNYRLNVLAIGNKGTLEHAPWRNTTFKSGETIALLGKPADVLRFAADFGLNPKKKPGLLESLNDPGNAGFAELIVPPRSGLAGASLRNYGMRHRYGVEPLIFYHRGERVEGDFSDVPVTPGDTFIVHGTWNKLAELRKGNDFIIVTPLEVETRERSRAPVALACFTLAIGLTFAGLPISIAFLTGAVAMILGRVLSAEEAYLAIDWKVVFFLAGLIPLGTAMLKTGTAAYLAGQVMSIIQGTHLLVLLLTIAVMGTVFSLFMSNVAATVILVPLVINMAQISGYDPRALVLLVAVAAGNSFILPTHQVNALLKTPGNYTNRDYLKAGGGMTLVFLVVVVGVFYVMYI